MHAAVPLSSAASLYPIPMPGPRKATSALPRLVPRPTARVAKTAALRAEQEALLLEHLPLVRVVARALAERLPSHVELDELMSAGRLGLLDAVRRFEQGRGVQFRSYAQFRIRGAMLDSLRSLDWGTRELRRKGRALTQARHGVEGRLGRPANESELAGAMGVELAELQQLMGKLRALELTSLNVERGQDSDEEELAYIPAKQSENPLFQYLEGESRQRVLSGMEALPERERLILRLYYFEEVTMREIGQMLGVVESRISQIHQEALRRLRPRLAALRATARPRARRVA